MNADTLRKEIADMFAERSQRITALEAQLAAITAERDAAVTKLDTLERSILDLSHPNLRLLLAERDAALAALAQLHATP